MNIFFFTKAIAQDLDPPINFSTPALLGKAAVATEPTEAVAFKTSLQFCNTVAQLLGSCFTQKPPARLAKAQKASRRSL